MRYKRMGKGGDYRLNIPQLNGGIHAETDKTLIADNELADAENVRFQSGALLTRPALRAVGNAPIGALDGNLDYAFGDTFENITPHPFEVDGEMCVVVIDQVNFKNAGTGSALSSRRMCRVVTLDGVVKKEYTFGGTEGDNGINALRNAVAFPCDKQQYGSDFLMIQGRSVYKPNDEAEDMRPIPDSDIYAPLVMVNGKSYAFAAGVANPQEGKANGVMYEGFNTLTRRFRCRFTGGGTGSYEQYYLPTAISGGVTVEGYTSQGKFYAQVPENGSAKVEIHADTVTQYTVTLNNAEKYVRIQPPLPPSDTADNIEITATAAASTEENVRGASIAAWFGGTNNRLGGTRLFLAGFADKPSKVMWSDVNNPLYFPENNYMYVGDMSQKITALEKQEDMFVIFKERETYYTTYVQGSIDKEAVIDGTNADVTVSQAYFPLTQLSPYIGCSCPHTVAVCNNRLIWMCADGRVYTLAAANPYSERNVRELGTKIHERLLAETTEEERRNASAADVDGCYMLLIGGTMFLFDYRGGADSAKQVAWYRYIFDGFAHGAWQRLLSDGAHKALLLSTCHILSNGGAMRCAKAFVRAAYVFDKQSRVDAFVRYTLENDSVSYFVEDHPIPVSFTTKSYDFGEPSAFKRIKALFLAGMGQAKVCFIADGEAGAPRVFSSQKMAVRLVMPSVKRCQTVAVRVESESLLAVRGLRFQYEYFGTVR